MVTDAVVDFARAAIAAMAITGGKIATVQAPDALEVTNPTVRWLIEQGGFVVVLMIVLFFYRRDFRAELSNQRAVNAVLVELVKSNTLSMQQLTSAIDELTRRKRG